MRAFLESLIDYFFVKLDLLFDKYFRLLLSVLADSDELVRVEITNWPEDGDTGGGEDPPPDDEKPKRTIIVSVETPYYKRIGTRNGKPLIEKVFGTPRAGIGTLLEAYVEKTNAIEIDEGATAPILTWELTRDLQGNDIRGLFINAGDAHIRE